MEDTFLHLVQNYGILGLLLYVVLKDAVPFFIEKVWPEKAKESHAKQQLEISYQKHQMEMDEREINAIEKMSNAVDRMAREITVNNERLSTLLASHYEHSADMREAVEHMKITSAKKKE